MGWSLRLFACRSGRRQNWSEVWLPGILRTKNPPFKTSDGNRALWFKLEQELRKDICHSLLPGLQRVWTCLSRQRWEVRRNRQGFSNNTWTMYVACWTSDWVCDVLNACLPNSPDPWLGDLILSWVSREKEKTFHQDELHTHLCLQFKMT